MKNVMKKTLPLLVCAAFAGTISANANAGVLAQSVLELDNLVFTSVNNGVLGPALSLTDFSSLQFVDSSSINTSLNGNTVGAVVGPISSFVGMDQTQICQGGPCPTENNYTQVSVVNGYLVRGDTLLQGSPINAFDPEGNPIVAGADAHTVAQATLDASGSGKASDDLNLTAQLTFSVEKTQAVGFSFDANAWLIAMLEAGSTGIGSTKSSLDWAITLSDEFGNDLLDWTPDGGAGGGLGVVELSDPCSLSRTRSATVLGANSSYTCSGNFQGYTSFQLIAGQKYTLGISHLSTAEALYVVPEPGALALVGLGLIGLGMSRRSKKA